MKQFLDIEAARAFIVAAMNYYQTQKAPGWFTDWLDDLYIRLSEHLAGVTLDELLILSLLNENDSWMMQSLAVNMTYKMFDRLGCPTTGIVGY